MNNFLPTIGQVCQMLVVNAPTPQWITCLPQAQSEYGIAVQVDIEGAGKSTHWFNAHQIYRDVIFRPIIGFHADWRHHSGEMYQMICIANEHTTKPGFERSVVYQNATTKVVYSRPAEVFLEKFAPVFAEAAQSPVEQSPVEGSPVAQSPVEPSPVEDCEILNSQDNPAMASPVLENAQ